MASGIFRLCKAITSCTSNFLTTNGLLKVHSPLIQNAKNSSSFFMKKTSNELWKSVTSVSNAGKRRGRGKSVPKIKNLNRGKKIGDGSLRVMFPGLNAPLWTPDNVALQPRGNSLESAEVNTQSESRKKRFTISPFLRGYTSASAGGRTCGAPSPIDDDTFEGFQSWILYGKSKTVMTSCFGRTRVYRTMVITGNRNGMAGFAAINGPEAKSSIIRARNKAGQRLIFIPRYNEHTVMHDFFTQFANTKIYVEQKPKGHGLICHRSIKTCCEAIGIKDLYAKIEGSKNVQSIIKAFFIGLIQQKTFQEIADDKRLHLVELSKETGYFPKVLASPEICRKKSEIENTEYLNLRQYLMNGRIYLHKKPYVPFYTRLPSWKNHLRKVERLRDQDKVILRAKAERGKICSFLVDKYPEAQTKLPKKREPNIEI